MHAATVPTGRSAEVTCPDHGPAPERGGVTPRSAEDERRDLNGEDHRAKRASERARAANDLVKRPNEKCSLAYAVNRGCVRC